MSGNDIRVCSARASFALNSHKVYYKSFKNAFLMTAYPTFGNFRPELLFGVNLYINPKRKAIC